MAKPNARTDELDPGVRKAAIAILALGSDLARDVFDVLEPEEIQMILRASEEIGDVNGEEVLRVLNELTKGNDRQVRGMSGNSHLLHEAAVDVLGADQLSMVMANEVEEDESKRRLSTMARNDPSAFAQILLKEHPQVIAAKVWEHMPAEVKSEAIRRIATMRSVPAHVMREVVQAVGAELESARSASPIDIDGMDSAVQLLKSAGSSQQAVIFEQLKQVDEELAENIRRRMFIFDDIINLHARDVQRILRDVDSQILPVALKNASTELQEHILGNMSQRASEMIMEDMEVLGPVTVKRVMEAQEGIVEVILRMSDEGKVNLNPEDAI